MPKPRQLTTSVRSVHLNLKALIVVILLLVAGATGLVALGLSARKHAGRKVMEVARQLRQAGQPDMVIRHLNQHLETEPADAEALALKAEVAAELAGRPGMLLPAAQAQEALIRVAPDSEEAQEARRRLVGFYIRYGDINRSIARSTFDDYIEARESRYGAAEKIANELISRGKGAYDVEAHRLRALALEGRAVPGDKAKLDETIREFRGVLTADPGDLVAGEHLSGLYRERLKDNARAEHVLDTMLKARPTSVEARLVRHRHFLKIRSDAKADAELKAASALAPDDLKVILTAAEDAIRRGATADARAHLAKVPPSSRGELRVMMDQGMVDFGEEHPDEAIASWRKCLMTSAGTDADTTWWLAYALTQLGRVTEAKPLVAQYQRLVGPHAPMLKFLEAVLDEKGGRPGRAIVRIDQIRSRLEPQWDGMIQLARGRCYEALSDEHKAAGAYTLAVQNDPTDIVPRLALANLRLKRKPAEAIVEVERGLALVPDDPALRVALANALLRREVAKPKAQQKFDAFDRAWREATALAPGASALVLMRADRLALVGKEPEAVEMLETAAALAPKSAAVAVALADGLVRLGRPARALAVVDRASKPDAAGDQAGLRIARARALIALNQGRKARSALVQDVEKLPVAERPQVWVALGQLEIARGDADAARRAYLEWAKLLPDDPRPRLVLLELALEQSDPTAVHARVEELRSLGDATAMRFRQRDLGALGGQNDIAYLLGRAKELVMEHDAAIPSGGDSGAALLEATAKVDAVLSEAPELPAAQMTKGQILERQPGKADEAIASYEKAWENGLEAALPRVIELMTRRQRFDALTKLRDSPAAAGATARLDLLSAQAFARVGDRTQAAQIAEKVVHELPDSAQAAGWQARMLDHLGRVEDAEIAMTALAERRPGELGPWLDLLRFQASRNRTAGAEATVAKIRQRVKAGRPELLEARIARARGDFDTADKAFAAAVARDPSNLATALEAASFYEQVSRTLEAEAMYRKALAIDPGNRPAARQLAVVLSMRGDPQAWLRGWEALGPETDSPEPEDRLARADLLTRCPDPNRRASSVPLLEALIADLPAKSPTAVRARGLYAKLLLEAGRNEQAAQVAAVSASEGTDPGSIALYAQALIQSKNPAAAEWQLDRLAAVNPGDLREATLRARMIWDRSRPVEAANALQRAYEIRENTPGAEALGREAFTLMTAMGNESGDATERLARKLAQKDPAKSWMLATVLAKRGLNDEALALLKTSARPGAAAEDLREVGRCAMQVAVAAGDDPVTLGKVAEVLTQSLGIQPTSDELLVMLAMLRHLQRDYKDEVRLYKSVLTRRPESYVVLMNLVWALSEGLHTPADAGPYLETLMKIAGGDVAAMDTHAMVALRLGKADDAVHEMEAVVASKPIGQHHFHLARAYKVVGRDADASKSFQAARKDGLSLREVDVAERDDFKALSEPVKVGQTK